MLLSAEEAAHLEGATEYRHFAPEPFGFLSHPAKVVKGCKIVCQQRTCSMHVHWFTTGELVSLSEKRFPGLVWTGEWHITALLADADGQPQYRIQSPDKLRERVVGEQELTVPVADRRAYPAA